MKVSVVGTLTTTSGSTFQRQVEFNLNLIMPLCSETNEVITILPSSSIAPLFYYFGDGELLIDVAEFSEVTSVSCTPSDIVYTFSVKPDRIG